MEMRKERERLLYDIHHMQQTTGKSYLLID